jgi:hypothetical protein
VTEVRPSNSPAHRRAPEALVDAADLLILTLVCLVGVTLWVGPFKATFVGVRLSVSSPVRALMLAGIVLAFRWWLDPHVPPLVARLRTSARAPLATGEAALFDSTGRDHPVLREFACVGCGFIALVAAITWPQMARLDQVPDLGDPLFSIWRIAWVNHQIWRHPLALFDTNIFYPARLTLAYSDPVIVPSVLVAPLFWIGIPKAVAYNVLLLSGFVLSGVTMYYLVRALTGRRDAAAIAGAVFASYPFRFEHYGHLELQMTMWMPLTLWAVHRALARGRWRDGVAAGVAFALQTLSSLYFGMFFAVYLLVLGAAVWIGRRFPARPIAALAGGAALAGAIVAPVAAPYLANKAAMGDRDLATVAFYSARGEDYLKAHVRARLYQRWSHRAHPERQLSPHIVPIALSVAGILPPLSVAQIGYAAALAVSLDGSLGVNGFVFPWLRDHVPGYAGLRVPARFSMLVGLTLAVLSGYGAARVLNRWPRFRGVITVGILAAVVVDALPYLELEPVWPRPPSIYDAIADDRSAVLAEFPMPPHQDSSWRDARYLYLSTFHWHPIVNGNSGWAPPSYLELLKQEREFPSDESIAYLRQRGVDYIGLHGAFTNPTRYRRTAELLDARDDLALVAVAPWAGSESRLYRLRR